ncbi:Alpha/beta hydrolase domain-containing protein 17C [Babesia sp. Xinjiang]|uniref:Alpha/beta hydrolase domain-containing protein 17C n=1 Tax=Babesia sp. Xinjiang TaxID=462227 RepID=UPI000A264182|nr:Alpha/beta hydrolase domain-containing protein 17C [Babesia sp. Xinjiang]ORM41368.1 Alpha/beta hydrolase domain-containing protein 17C [Babesia sp. Xinjiang]
MGNILTSAVFLPPKATYNSTDPHVHMLPTKEGYTLAAYFIKHRDARYTILYSHGNAEDIGHVLPLLVDRISKWQVNLLMYDYSGYGLSGGKPSEENLYKNIEAVYDHMISRFGVDPNKVIVYGRSIGSGPTVHLALRRPVLGVILQSPIASVYRVRMRRLPCSLPGDMFRNADKVELLEVPTLILHGTKDEIVPLESSQRMARKISEVYCQWIEGASHNDIDTTYADQADEAILEYLDKVLPRDQYGRPRTAVWSGHSDDDDEEPAITVIYR